MNDNDTLIDTLIVSGVLKTPELIHAFEHCDRKLFVPTDLIGSAYEDRPLPIGFSQTISQPFTVAFMMELLHPLRGEHLLDIGSGSG